MQRPYARPAVFNGVGQLLDALHGSGTRLAIVTAKGERAAELSLDRVPVAHRFDAVITATRESVRKAPRILEQIARWSLEPVDAAYIGDTQSDMAQAVEAGVTALGAAWGGVATPAELLEAGATAVFTNPARVLDWMTGARTE